MFDEIYFRSYASSLLNLESIDEIISSLPDKKQDGYEEFIINLISYVNSEIDSNKALISEGTDESDLGLLNVELDKLSKVREELLKRLNDLSNEEEIPPGKKNIVFLTTAANKACALNDIKDIPGEYAQSVIDLLDRLENYGDSFKYDETDSKKVKGCKKSKNVFELKDFKVRVVFERGDMDTVIVLMIAYKNQTNPKTVRETLDSRMSMPVTMMSGRTKISKIKEDLLNPELKSKMIEEHKLIKEEIKEQLKRKIR